MHQLDDSAPVTKGQKLLVALGATGLFAAMGADGIAVLGRHAGFTLLGAIEIFQAALVMSLSCAVLLASVMERHAAVDLLLGRVPPTVRRRLAIIGRASLAVTFGLICAGSAWVAYELWGTHEMTEIIGIAVLPLRLIWTVACGLATLYFAVTFVRALRA